jgi:Resolvase, N terminal domain
MGAPITLRLIVRKYLNWCGKHQAPRTVEWYHAVRFLLACQHKAVLVVYKLDRLARNTRDVLEWLQKSKADLTSLVEQINSHSPMGKFFFTEFAAFADPPHTRCP